MTVFRPIPITIQPTPTTTSASTGTLPKYQSRIDQALSNIDPTDLIQSNKSQLSVNTHKRSSDSDISSSNNHMKLYKSKSYSANTSPNEYYKRSIANSIINNNQLHPQQLNKQSLLANPSPPHTIQQQQSPNQVVWSTNNPNTSHTFNISEKLQSIQNNGIQWLTEWYQLSTTARTNALITLNQSLQKYQQIHQDQPIHHNI